MVAAICFVRVAAAAASFAGVFWETGARRRACAMALAVSGLPLVGELTYTRMSLYAALMAAADEAATGRAGPLPVFLLVNSAGLTAAFRWAAAIDPAAVAELARRSGYSPSFVTGWGGALMHEFPTALLAGWVAWRADEHARAAPPGPAVGLATAAAHLLWAALAFASLDVSPAYAPLAPGTCEAAWAAGVAVHLAAGCLWLAAARALRAGGRAAARLVRWAAARLGRGRPRDHAAR